MEWNCLGIRFTKQEALVSHANAALTARTRPKVAKLVVDRHVPVAEVAARFQCSLADGWAYASAYASERERRAALSAWIHE